MNGSPHAAAWTLFYLDTKGQNLADLSKTATGLVRPLIKSLLHGGHIAVGGRWLVDHPFRDKSGNDIRRQDKAVTPHHPQHPLPGDTAQPRAQLADLSPRIGLPTIAARGPMPGSRFRRIRWELPSALVTELDAMARRQGVTLFVLAASAFGAMLGLRSKTLDVRFATLMSLRDQPELLDLVAPMIETVILRAPINPDKSAARYLQVVQRALVGAMRNGHLPIEEVVAAAAPDRDLLSHPLCQALLIFQRPIAPGDDLAGALDGTGLTLSNFAAAAALPPTDTDEFEVTTFEIICEVEATASGIVIVMRYDADIFDDTLARSMCKDMQDALQAIANGPQTPVGRLLDAADLRPFDVAQ